MKTNRSIIQSGIVLLALFLLLALLTFPVLAKGVAAVKGDEVQPEKLEISPIPVPVPPLSVAIKESPVSLTPTPASSAAATAPEAIAVLTPPASAVPTRSFTAQNSMLESSTGLVVPTVNRESTMVVALTLIVLLISVCVYRTSNVHSLNGRTHDECSIC